jgi:hypothetical protein
MKNILEMAKDIWDSKPRAFEIYSDLPVFVEKELYLNDLEFLCVIVRSNGWVEIDDYAGSCVSGPPEIFESLLRALNLKDESLEPDFKRLSTQPWQPRKESACKYCEHSKADANNCEACDMANLFKEIK